MTNIDLTFRSKLIEQKKRTIVVRKEKNMVHEKLKKELEVQLNQLTIIENLMAQNDIFKNEKNLALDEIGKLKQENKKIKSENNIKLQHKEIDSKKENKEIEKLEKEIKALNSNIKKIYEENRELNDYIKEQFEEREKLSGLVKKKEIEFVKLNQEIYIKSIENQNILKDFNKVKSRLNIIESKYDALSSSKLGSLTIKYWKMKKGNK